MNSSASHSSGTPDTQSATASTSSSSDTSGQETIENRTTDLVEESREEIVSGTKAEQVIFGEGLGNGLVVIARRLITQRLVANRDPRL